MTIALMTDIHANREAFEACLAHAGDHGVDQFVLLGDFVGYGADPEWVLDTLIDLVARGATALMGNHDAAAIWSKYATRIERTATVPSGHYLQEECPDETYTELRNFFAAK